MIKGLYTSAVGMMVRQTKQDIIANNLANANTVGYKQDAIHFRNTLDASTLLNDDPNVAPVEEVRTNFAPAELEKTGSPFDLAIEGDGFFVLSDGTQTYYTRDGHFTLTDAGELVAANGWAVMGEGGPVVLPKPKMQIGEDGTISSDGIPVGKLAIVRFENPQELVKVGHNAFRTIDGDDPSVPAEATVRQGFLEMSNVRPIEAMVEMIFVMRDFTQAQKSIQAQDETLRRVVNELGRS